MGRKFANINIGKKLGFLIGGTMLAMLLLIGVSWWATIVLDAADDAGQAQANKNLLAQRIATDVNEVSSLVADLLIDNKHRPETEINILALRKTYMARMEELKTLSATGQEGRHLSEWNDALGRWRAANVRIIELAKEGKTAEAATVRSQQSETLSRDLRAALEQYLVYGGKQRAEIERLQMLDISRTRYLLISVGLISLLVAVLFGIVLNRGITVPLRAAVAHLEVVARGDVSRDVPEENQERQDEIGGVSRAMQAMSVSLRGILGDVAGGIHVLSSSSAELSANSGKMSEGSRQASSKAHAVAAATEQMTVNVVSVAAGMEQASTNLTSVASATEQMTATIGEIAYTYNVCSTYNARTDMAANKQNLTISVSPETIRKAKMLAAQRSTSISRLLAEQVEILVGTEEAYVRSQNSALALLDHGFHLGGRITASRDDLHER